MNNKEIAKRIGENMKRYRKMTWYTQQKLAEEAGIDRSALSKAENGEYLPTIGFLLAISRTVKVEISEFFIGVNSL